MWSGDNSILNSFGDGTQVAFGGSFSTGQISSELLAHDGWECGEVSGVNGFCKGGKSLGGEEHECMIEGDAFLDTGVVNCCIDFVDWCGFVYFPEVVGFCRVVACDDDLVVVDDV